MFMHIRDFVQNPPPNPFYAVIGHPVAQSKSPLLHNFALKSHNLNASYVALDTPADAFAWVGQLVEMPNFRGMNVTIPHKSRIMDLLQVIDPLAMETGAVNTVHPVQIGLAGYNTDISGLEKTLMPHALLFAGRPAIILGSGGAARAAVASLRKFGISEAFVISRKPSAIRWPATLNKVKVKPASYEQLPEVLKQASLIINTTPVGMYPNADASPIPVSCVPLLKGKVCMDAIYNPIQTAFLKQAAHAGANATIPGTGMFIGQAADAFRIWTGKAFPTIDAEKLLLDSLIKNDAV
jgi:shikimate dehydrogenase